MPHLNDIQAKSLTEGILGKYVHGEKSTFGVIEIKKGSDMGAHSHPHEQITMVLEGELEMLIGQEKIILKPGTIHVIPSNTVHAAIAHTDCKLIDIFSPTREEYK